MAIEKKYVETPLMKQYYAVKAVHPDAILLFLSLIHISEPTRRS